LAAITESDRYVLKNLEEAIMCSYPDVEWVHLLKQEPPDEAALVCVWHDIYRFCYDQMLGYGLDEDAALDAAHETLRRLLRSLALASGGFRFECSLRTYWRTIAARCVKTIVTKEIRRQRRGVLLSQLEEIEQPDGVAFVDLRAGQELILQRLKPCLERLPKRQRSVIILRYLTRNEHGEFEENSLEQVAEVLEITRGAVAVASAHARASLRLCLEAHEFHSSSDIGAL
jgi:RNA polymerase sigma factor (sigma-70 family)